jgi:hypothetical protein
MSQFIELTSETSTELFRPRKQTKFSAGPICAALLIAVATICMFTSSWNDSPAWDEPEHITAGYLYLTTGSYELNCWHPPLVKDIAALPLLFMDLFPPPNEPRNVLHNPRGAWTKFFFETGNDAQSIVRAARAPLIILFAIFCIFFYWRLRQEYGDTIYGLDILAPPTCWGTITTARETRFTFQLYS